MKKKKLIIFDIIFVVAVGILFIGGVIDDCSTIKIDKENKVVFTNVRPDSSNPDILLCIPAAFSTGNHHIIGHYSTGKGRRGVTSKGYTTVFLDDNTHFQQATLVRRHRPQPFRDTRLRYRRALCKKGDRYSVVQSKYPVTLSRFARNLTGYDSAWNLDMGVYSYGWYKKNGRLHHLSASTFWNKRKQTNWIVVKK